MNLLDVDVLGAQAPQLLPERDQYVQVSDKIADYFSHSDTSALINVEVRRCFRCVWFLRWRHPLVRRVEATKAEDKVAVVVMVMVTAQKHDHCVGVCLAGHNFYCAR